VQRSPGLPTPLSEQLEPAFAGVWSRLEPNHVVAADAPAGISATAPSAAVRLDMRRDRLVKMLVMTDI
jgi:hypothetical protein